MLLLQKYSPLWLHCTNRLQVLKHDVQAGGPFEAYLESEIAVCSIDPITLTYYMFWFDIDELRRTPSPNIQTLKRLASKH